MSWRLCRHPRPPASALTGRPLVQRPHSPKGAFGLHHLSAARARLPLETGGGKTRGQGGNKGASPQPPPLGQGSRLAGLLVQRLLCPVAVGRHGQRLSNPPN